MQILNYKSLKKKCRIREIGRSTHLLPIASEENVHLFASAVPGSKTIQWSEILSVEIRSRFRVSRRSGLTFFSSLGMRCGLRAPLHVRRYPAEKIRPFDISTRANRRNVICARRRIYGAPFPHLHPSLLVNYFSNACSGIRKYRRRIMSNFENCGNWRSHGGIYEIQSFRASTLTIALQKSRSSL